jgi:CheY-like chemotaxis protein
MSYGTEACVLLVEPDASLRRLIALGLQSRDVHVIATNTAPELPQCESPDLLILDIDDRASSDQSLLPAIQEHPRLSTLPVVLLAWDAPALVAAPGAEKTHVTYLAKPFDARALFATIEGLLAERALAEIEPVQAVLLPARRSSSAPSILPLVTAAGLLLASIGLLGLFAFSALGLCIVVAALLWWTTGIGTKPQQEGALPLSGRPLLR